MVLDGIFAEPWICMGQNSWRKPHVLEDWRFMGYPHNSTCICILTIIFITSKKAGSQVHICWAVTAPAVCFKGCALSIPRQKFSWVPCCSFPLSHGGDLPCEFTLPVLILLLLSSQWNSAYPGLLRKQSLRHIEYVLTFYCECDP